MNLLTNCKWVHNTVSGEGNIQCTENTSEF